MTKKKAVKMALIPEAVAIAERIEAQTGDEFTAWLAAFITINGDKKNLSVDEISAAWMSYQAFKETGNF